MYFFSRIITLYFNYSQVNCEQKFSRLNVVDGGSKSTVEDRVNLVRSRKIFYGVIFASPAGIRHRS